MFLRMLLSCEPHISISVYTLHYPNSSSPLAEALRYVIIVYTDLQHCLYPKL